MPPSLLIVSKTLIVKSRFSREGRSKLPNRASGASVSPESKSRCKVRRRGRDTGGETAGMISPTLTTTVNRSNEGEERRKVSRRLHDMSCPVECWVCARERPPSKIPGVPYRDALRCFLQGSMTLPQSSQTGRPLSTHPPPELGPHW